LIKFFEERAGRPEALPSPQTPHPTPLKKKVRRALPDISFPGGLGVSPRPALAWAPG